MKSEWILVIAVLIIMGWFAFGVIYNLRRGDAVLKWIQKGLPRIGPRTTFRWLGSSVAELVIAKASKPFRKLETLLVLMPRDVFWMTIIALFQGRRDVMIFRGQLSVAPLLDLDLCDPKSWSGRNALTDAAKRGWESKPYKELTLTTPKGLLSLAESTLERLSDPMQKFSPRFARFALRKDGGLFEIHVPFPNIREDDASAYFDSLKEFAGAINEHE